MLYEKVEALLERYCMEAEMASEKAPSISFLDYGAEHYLAISLVANDLFRAITTCSSCVLED